ncbi:MAG: autotransporter outer membrane beta-barrel domain-containing protein, partial [Pseudoxanthomonas sp.]
SAVWTPYASINAVREFDGENAFSINDDFSGRTSAEGTNALVEAGLNVDLGRLSVFGGANWQDGGALESIVSGQVGMRFAW